MKFGKYEKGKEIPMNWSEEFNYKGQNTQFVLYNDKNLIISLVNLKVILFLHRQLMKLHHIMDFQLSHPDYRSNQVYFYLSLYLMHENLYVQKYHFENKVFYIFLSILF